MVAVLLLLWFYCLCFHPRCFHFFDTWQCFTQTCIIGCAYFLCTMRYGDGLRGIAEIIVMELLMMLSLVLVLSLISLNTVKYDYHVLLKLILFTYCCVAATRYRDATLL
jgi:hypothetical protein